MSGAVHDRPRVFTGFEAVKAWSHIHGRDSDDNSDRPGNKIFDDVVEWKGDGLGGRKADAIVLDGKGW